MSLLEKIKKLFTEEKFEQVKDLKEVKIEEISFKQLSEKLGQKSKDYIEKSNEIKNEIKSKINIFVSELDKKIEILEHIDHSKRKEQEKIKLVVIENLNLYINYLKRLAENLEKADNSDVQKYITRIIEILNDFNKSSHTPFEKATILIGKELGETKTLISEFFKDIDKILENNKNLIKEQEIIEKLNKLVKELNENNQLNEETNTTIKNLSEEFEKIKKSSEETKKEIEEIKKSSEFKIDYEEKEKFNKNKHELERKIQSVKQKMDLKKLAKNFYKDTKKSQIIKEYSENFVSALEKDDNLIITILIDEFSPNSNLDKEIKEIKDNLDILKKDLITPTDRKINQLDSRLKDLERRSSDIKIIVEQEFKKKDKQEIRIKELKDEIKSLGESLFDNVKIV